MNRLVKVYCVLFFFNLISFFYVIYFFMGSLYVHLYY